MGGNVVGMVRKLNALEKAATRIAASKAGAWFFIHVTAKVDPMLLKASKGRISSMVGQPVLLLKHRGARSGKARETPLVYATDGTTVVLIASMGGSPTNPAWFHNLTLHPDCEIIAKGRTGRYRARTAQGTERDRLWSLATDVYAGYDVYQARTGGRVIPVVVLEPVV